MGCIDQTFSILRHFKIRNQVIKLKVHVFVGTVLRDVHMYNINSQLGVKYLPPPSDLLYLRYQNKNVFENTLLDSVDSMYIFSLM